MEETNRALGIKIINAAKAEIYLRMRFFHISLGYLKLFDEWVFLNEQSGYATDGQYIFFNSDWLIRKYLKEKKRVHRDLIHLLLHCLYKHPFKLNPSQQSEHYDLACDIIVESIIDNMELFFLEKSEISRRREIYKTIQGEHTTLLIHHVLNHLNHLDKHQIEDYEDLFSADDHRFWPSKTRATEEPQETSDSSEKSETIPPKDENHDDSSENQASDSTFQQSIHHPKIEHLAQIWGDLGAQLTLDLETFNKEAGTEHGGLKEHLKIANQRSYDYKDSLQKFLEVKEVYREDLDAFDPIYYLYGLYELGRRPLIEYAEYKEVPVLDELAIVIDTSGSTYYSVVSKFLEITYNIILTTAHPTHQFKIYIIQVDTQVQDAKLITGFDDFKAYMDDFELKGGGGTDFKPGFAYVDKLIADKAINRLKGLIYFTDGYGDFPETAPAYDSLIVFHESSYTEDYVPLWASKIIITEDDIHEYT